MSAPDPPPRWPRDVPGTRFTDVRHLAAVDSTNRVVLEEAAAGAGEGLVVVADHQSAGRGRLDRRWEAPPGTNLLVSVLLRPDLPLTALHRCATAVALAAAEACSSVAGLAVGCKWPNDLVVGDRKLAGLLAETVQGPVTGRPPAPAPAAAGARAAGSGAGWGPVAVVVGVGLNVDWPGPGDEVPPDLQGRATSIRAETGRRVDRPALLQALLVDLHGRLLDLQAPGGASRLAAAYRERCATLGRRVVVETARATVVGTAEAVDDDGALVVVGDDGARHVVVVGDVVHLRPEDDGSAAPGT